MNIKTITVEVHEKRNHPRAYGHYDSRVAYTAEVLEGEDADKIVGDLQFMARQHVAIECDRWIAEIELENKREHARSNLNWIVDTMRDNGSISDSRAEAFERDITLLPEVEQGDYRSRLEAAKGDFQTRMRRELDSFIERAQRFGSLDRYDRSDFKRYLPNIPQEDRAGYSQRLEDALAPKTEAAPVEVAEKEDLPF